MTSTAGTKTAEIAVNALLINVAATLLTIPFLGVAVVVAAALPHAVPLSRFEVLWFIMALSGCLVAHELVHALSLVVYARMPWRIFRFGFHWRQLVFYCHCPQPVTIRTYRYCALAPLVVLGSATTLVTLIYPAIWLASTTAIHLAACIGDVWIWLKLRRFPPSFLVMDFPDRIGGAIFEPASNLSPCRDQT
jgi:hypothetical protein